ncbi:phosphoribosylanthranilate isomerase [Tamlana haliotis]|uniref:N-(5'-phosphoribosyl)anthranilate isomerase n=1 Tax=Pseudotamlana haliotis TaxID=2614804 RepID=A0A6N6MI93_9FLAO|nr:phosphoribosylanthranilate isomerase [Tamlana haliotis]KAB1069198.1 phosphoribosylanthranilate isomerase [Tamlana haliotis]
MKFEDNIEAVASLQPDYLGFIFFEKSERDFGTNHIPEIPSSIKKVGVFVDAEINFVIEKVNTLQLQAIQLHGHESPEYCDALKHTQFFSETNDELLKIDVIKVFSIKDSFNFEVLKPYEDVCDYFLFDTKGKLPGGNGYTFDWNVLNEYPSEKPFFLSGGIGVDEISDINKFQNSKASKHCYALDVNSKFEIKPGLKNIELLKEFKQQVFTNNENKSS